MRSKNGVVMSLLIAASVIRSAPSLGADGASVLDNATIKTLNNFVDEHATCVAYVALNEQCIKNRNEASDKDAINLAQDYLRVLISNEMQIGALIGMTSEAMQARNQLIATEMQDQLGSCVNLSALILKHRDSCKQLVNTFDDALHRHLGGGGAK